MTGHDDFDRTLAGWFEADALAPAPAGGLDRVLDATRHRRPRPIWVAGPGSHWVGEAHEAGSNSGSLTRLGLSWSTALILLLAIVALVSGAILVGARLFQPSPLPTGRLGHLTYGLDGDIYVADWDGRNPVRIADGPPILPSGDIPCASYGGEGPMWSPDGRYLAYRQGGAVCPGAIVFISDPAGHVVASFPGTGWLVSWSPDSTRVATSVDLGHTFGIYGLDGVRQALHTVPLGYEVHGDYDPVWSPDGLSLLMPIAPVAPSTPSEIWEFPVGGGTPRRVPDEDPRSHPGAAYSRDGARVAFVSYFEPYRSLVIAKADGTEIRVLVGAKNVSSGPPDEGDYYENPMWSPTGDRVAFIWSHGSFQTDLAGDPLPRAYELRVVDVASGTVTSLASARGTAPLAPIRFSPEGDRVLFSRTDANGVGSLWGVQADGSDARLLVPGSGWGDWQWLPAGP